MAGSGGPPPVLPNHGAIIIDPNGTHHPIISGRFSSAVNVGCQWSVVIPYQIDLFSYGEFGEWLLVVGNRGGGTPWESCPPLKMKTGSAGGNKTTISGIDMASYRLSISSIHATPHADEDAWDIIQAVGTEFGVTILFNAGCPRFDVEAFPPNTTTTATESKPKVSPYANPLAAPGSSSPGASSSAPVRQVAGTSGNLIADLIHKLGCIFRINNDHIEVLPADLSLGVDVQKTPVSALVVANTTHQLNESKKVNSIILQKPANTGGLGGAYTYDWSTIYPVAATADDTTITISSPFWPNQAAADAVAPLIFFAYNKDRGESLLCDLDPLTTFGLPGFDIPADPVTYAFYMESIEMQIGVQNSMTVAGPITNFTLPPANPPT